MATAEQLKALIDSYVQGDEPRFRAVAMQIAASSAKQGKTKLAEELRERHLPLMVVQLHSLITKFMGETAAKLHLIFEAMEKTPGVYLFDEFDAIGAVRRAEGDVGEIRRVLNSFLQFLDVTKSDSLVVAATNLLPLLDQALFRRFDVVLRYDLPDADATTALLENRLSRFQLDRGGWATVTTAAAGLSHADIVRAAEEAAKRAVLNERETITTDELAGALEKRRAARLPSSGGGHGGSS